MAALCLYLADGSRRDLEDTLEKATSHYLRGGSPRHASKAALLQLDLLKRPPTKGSKAEALRRAPRDFSAASSKPRMRPSTVVARRLRASTSAICSAARRSRSMALSRKTRTARAISRAGRMSSGASTSR